MLPDIFNASGREAIVLLLVVKVVGRVFQVGAKSRVPVAELGDAVAEAGALLDCQERHIGSLTTLIEATFVSRFNKARQVLGPQSVHVLWCVRVGLSALNNKMACCLPPS